LNLEDWGLEEDRLRTRQQLGSTFDVLLMSDLCPGHFSASGRWWKKHGDLTMKMLI